MFPIRDSVPSQTFPIVNILIIVTNTVIFVYEVSLGPELEALFGSYGLIPTRFFQLLANHPSDVVNIGFPFFSSMFLHGGWAHFIGNMWFLWIFGDNVEDRMGHGRYIFFYLLMGIGAGAVHLAFNTDSSVPTIGASGAISGVMGAYLMLYPGGRVTTYIPPFFFLAVPAFLFLILWMVLQTFQGLASLGLPSSAGGVAWWAHIGGFVLGAVLVFVFRKRRPESTEI